MQSTDRGIVFVVFGKSYETMAAHTVRISRRYTKLPFHVITNIPLDELLPTWRRIKDVTFQHLPLPDAQNRIPKIQLYRYTPFDQTLYIDCDAVVMRDDVERAFECLAGADITLAPRFFWRCGEQIPEVYVKAFRTLGVRLPVDAWHGAIFAFDRCSEAARGLMDLWLANWEALGRYRDLPALVSAVRRLTAAGRLAVAKLPSDFFGLKSPDSLTVWHPQPGKPEEFMRRFKIPPWTPWSPHEQRYERWNTVFENCELSPDRELPELPCPAGGPLCVTAYAFGDYAEYAPLLAYTTLWNYPDAVVKLYFKGPAPANVLAALAYLRKQLSPNICVVDNYDLPLKTGSGDLAHNQAGKCVRWLIPGSEFAGFEYTYMADIDFIIVKEHPELLEKHKAISRELGVPHSNPIRWSYHARVSGLQMVETAAYFAAIDPVASPYRTGAKPVPAVNNEAFLFSLLQAGGILPKTRPANRPEFDRLRPHPGYHIGLVRSCKTPPDYTDLWRQLAPASATMLSSPMLAKLLRFVEVPWVAVSIERTLAYISQALGKPLRMPALRENSGAEEHRIIGKAHRPGVTGPSTVGAKDRQMRNRMVQLQKAKVTLLPTARHTLTYKASTPVISAQPPVRAAATPAHTKHAVPLGLAKRAAWSGAR